MHAIQLIDPQNMGDFKASKRTAFLVIVLVGCTVTGRCLIIYPEVVVRPRRVTVKLNRVSSSAATAVSSCRNWSSMYWYVRRLLLYV